VEKLGTVMIRVIPDESSQGEWVKVVTPAGKTGYVAVDGIAPVGSDQLCYLKDASGWKIVGYVGAGTGQE
jgi:hypothetical protein